MANEERYRATWIGDHASGTYVVVDTNDGDAEVWALYTPSAFNSERERDAAVAVARLLNGQANENRRVESLLTEQTAQLGRLLASVGRLEGFVRRCRTVSQGILDDLVGVSTSGKYTGYFRPDRAWLKARAMKQGCDAALGE